MASKHNSAQGETKRPTGDVNPQPSDSAVIAVATPGQKRAIARGRTVGQSGRNVAPEPFTLRQRAMYPDELHDAGSALYRARTSGVLRGIRESKIGRDQSKRAATAMGRQNIRMRRALGKRMAAMGEAKHPTSLPHFLTHRIGNAATHEISDLTKTGMGAPTRRKGRAASATMGHNRLKTPTEGGRKRKSRKKKRRRTRRRSRGRRRRTRRGGMCGSCPGDKKRRRTRRRRRRRR